MPATLSDSAWRAATWSFEFLQAGAWGVASSLLFWRSSALRRHWPGAVLASYLLFFMIQSWLVGAGFHVMAGEAEWGDFGLSAVEMAPSLVGCLAGYWLGTVTLRKVAS